MAFIGPWEIALIIIVALIFFGPKKLPELARSMGKAIQEYRKATSSFEQLIQEPGKTIEKELTTTTPHPPTPTNTPTSQTSAEETLLETAKHLHIKTEGKTLQQISNEIIQRSTPPPTKTSPTKQKPTKQTKPAKPTKQAKPSKPVKPTKQAKQSKPTKSARK